MEDSEMSASCMRLLRLRLKGSITQEQLNHGLLMLKEGHPVGAGEVNKPIIINTAQNSVNHI
jgi:hypothetical protein